MTSRSDERELFARRDDPDARAELVERYDYLAQHLARRFSGRGTELDDLVQAARFGLVNAIDRYDPDRGVKFSTYAGRTIVGEIKHHFRAHAWSLRVPRSLQNLWMRTSDANEELTQSLGRSPTVRELAEHLDVGTDEVLAAMEAGGEMRAASLDRPVGSSDGSAAEMVDFVGERDRRLQNAPEWAAIEPELANLAERDQTVLYLRFFEGRTQQEIAEHIGVSQVHVSRLIRSAVETVRVGVLGHDEPPND